MRVVVSTIGIVILAAIVALSFHVLLTGFAGLLVAILLRTVADWIAARSRLSPTWALALVVIGLAALLAGNVWLFGRSFAGQIDEMSEGVFRARDQLYEYSQRYDWSRKLWPKATEQSGGAMMWGARSVAIGTMDVAAGFILMLFIALYVSANPELYRRGFLKLFNSSHHQKARKTIDAISNSLRWWILGQVVSMIVVGILTTAGLLILGVPLPFTLGFITAVLNFIPNIGAILSAVLAMVLALTNGVQSMLYVLVLFLVIQSFEAYILTPLIQQRTVELPPALTISVQALMAVLVGGIGLALAAPLTVVGLVLTRHLYLNDDSKRTFGKGRSGGPRSSLRAAEARSPKAST